MRFDNVTLTCAHVEANKFIDGFPRANQPGQNRCPDPVDASRTHLDERHGTFYLLVVSGVTEDALQLYVSQLATTATAHACTEETGRRLRRSHPHKMNARSGLRCPERDFRRVATSYGSLKQAVSSVGFVVVVVVIRGGMLRSRS